MRIADMDWRMVEDWLRGDDRGVLPLGSVEQHAGHRGALARSGGCLEQYPRATVAAHGGTVEFQSEHGKGTTFQITLPKTSKPKPV